METSNILQTEFQKDKGYSPFTCPESLNEYVKWLEEKIAYSAVAGEEKTGENLFGIKSTTELNKPIEGIVEEPIKFAEFIQAESKLYNNYSAENLTDKFLSSHEKKAEEEKKTGFIPYEELILTDEWFEENAPDKDVYPVRHDGFIEGCNFMRERILSLRPKEERIMSFRELSRAILNFDAESIYKQTAIVMLRTIFETSEKIEEEKESKREELIKVIIAYLFKAGIVPDKLPMVDTFVDEYLSPPQPTDTNEDLG